LLPQQGHPFPARSREPGRGGAESSARGRGGQDLPLSTSGLSLRPRGVGWAAMLEPTPVGDVHRVVLYPSEGERAKEAAVTAAGWLINRGVSVATSEWFLARHREVMPGGCVSIDAEAISDDAFDLMIALGGDGTLLRAARAVAEVGIPVMGVNLGNLGFLSAFGASELVDALQTAVDGRLTWEPRLRMTVEVMRGGGVWSRQTACNDTYVKHGATPRMLQLSTMVGGYKMADFRADGLIVSTPMGSTAYNLA